MPFNLSAHLVTEQSPLAQRCLDLTEYITKCTHGIVTEKVASLSEEEKAGVTLLDQLRSFHEESLEWETASQFMADALQKISKDELERISQTLDHSGKIDTIKHELEEPAGEFAVDLYIVGNNENITSRGVERYPRNRIFTTVYQALCCIFRRLLENFKFEGFLKLVRMMFLPNLIKM